MLELQACTTTPGSHSINSTSVHMSLTPFRSLQIWDICIIEIHKNLGDSGHKIVLRKSNFRSQRYFLFREIDLLWMYLWNRWVPLSNLYLHNHILTLYKRKAYLSSIPNPSLGQLKYWGWCQDSKWLAVSGNQSFLKVLLWLGPCKGVSGSTHM
jgi:hypothetical protein